MQISTFCNSSAEDQRRVGILGGSFNPIHDGHLLIAEAALNQGNLDQIIWVPTYHPPHKSVTLASFEHRMAMVQRAIAPYPQFIASDVDRQRGGSSYAIATFNDLALLYPHANWSWVIGLDAFQRLPQWRNSTELAHRCQWLVAPRHTQNAQTCAQHIANQFALRSIQLRWHLLLLPLIDISSSQIRQDCQQAQSPTHVPDSVREYLLLHELYRGGGEE